METPGWVVGGGGKGEIGLDGAHAAGTSKQHRNRSTYTYIDLLGLWRDRCFLILVLLLRLSLLLFLNGQVAGGPIHWQRRAGVRLSQTIGPTGFESDKGRHFIVVAPCYGGGTSTREAVYSGEEQG